MGWNYRLLQAYHKLGRERHYYVQLVEVYYDDAGVPRNYGTLPDMAADTVEDMEERLELLRIATEKPLLRVAGNQLIEIKKEEL